MAGKALASISNYALSKLRIMAPWRVRCSGDPVWHTLQAAIELRIYTVIMLRVTLSGSLQITGVASDPEFQHYLAQPSDYRAVSPM